MDSADLHLHTQFSDGTYTPRQLVAEAKAAGLRCIAVVDHDTVGGVAETIEAASPYNLEVLPGIELSAEHERTEIHILGYLLDYKSKALAERLDFLKQNRVERVHEISRRLGEMGVRLDPQEVFDIASRGTVGRLHIARVMLKKGIVNSISEAFQKYIGDKCPAYVCGFKFSPEAAIKLILGQGGVPVLAHPYSVNRDELIQEFVGYGLMGLEAYYPEHTGSMTRFYLSLARKFNLLVTGGSDCHGSVKPESRVGSIKISYDLVKALKEAKPC